VGAGPDLQDLVNNAVAVIVATRDDELRPQISRAWGPSLSEDGASLTVCVEAGSDSTMMSNLNAGSPVAVTVARLASHTTVQLKGLAVDVSLPTSERLAAVAEHTERFVAEGESAGMPEAFARGLIGHDLMTVTIEVAQRSDETPGPDAGRSL
jgi:hypothetical protein